MEAAAVDALQNDRFVSGENVVKFEEEFAEFIGTEYAVAVSSGTAALDLILTALGINDGDQIVTTTWSFIASANSIMHVGGKPVFSDISDTDYCLDPRGVEYHLKLGAKAILPVHIYGQPIDFDIIGEMGERYKVPIIEDSCQSHGARYKGKRTGSLGAASAFSFYPSKNMSVLGDGGMVTTDDEEIARMVMKLRDCGRTSQYEHDVLGYTARLNSVNAAIGRVQLRHLLEWNKKRLEIAGSYFIKLSHLSPDIQLPPMPSRGIEPVFHQFVIRTKKRDELKNYLEQGGVQCAIHYPMPVHLQPLYVKKYGFTEGMYRKSEQIARECLSLPMHPFLSDDDVNFICDGINAFFS